MGMKKNGVCIGRQTMDTAPMRTNEICPSYFLPLHAHSRVIFEICRSYFLPPFPPGTMLDDRHRICHQHCSRGEGGKNKTGRFPKKSEILALFGGALMISHTPFFYSPIRRASILDVNDDQNKTGRFQ